MSIRLCLFLTDSWSSYKTLGFAPPGDFVPGPCSRLGMGSAYVLLPCASSPALRVTDTRHGRKSWWLPAFLHELGIVRLHGFLVRPGAPFGQGLGSDVLFLHPS